MKNFKEMLDYVLTGMLLGTVLGGAILVGTLAYRSYNDWRHVENHPVHSEMFTRTMNKVSPYTKDIVRP